MTDPRNIAHDKKVAQEKKHHGDEVAPGVRRRDIWHDVARYLEQSPLSCRATKLHSAKP